MIAFKFFRSVFNFIIPSSTNNQKNTYYDDSSKYVSSDYNQRAPYNQQQQNYPMHPYPQQPNNYVQQQPPAYPSYPTYPAEKY